MGEQIVAQKTDSAGLSATSAGRKQKKIPYRFLPLSPHLPPDTSERTGYAPCLVPATARKAGTRLTCPGGIEG